MRATARQHQRHSNADKPPREHDDAPDDGPLNSEGDVHEPKQPRMAPASAWRARGSRR